MGVRVSPSAHLYLRGGSFQINGTPLYQRALQSNPLATGSAWSRLFPPLNADTKTDTDGHVAHSLAPIPPRLTGRERGFFALRANQTGIGMNEKLLSKVETASFLGISVRALERLIQRRQIRVIRLSSRCVRIHRPDILFRHYRELVSREEAEKYYAVFPAKS